MEPSSPPHLANFSSKQQYYLFIIVGMALIVFVVLLANAFAVGYCAWLWRLFPSQPPPPQQSTAVQTWIPAHEYKKKDEEADVECVVCLSAIADGEMVRELLQCRHMFHEACIDLWFRSNTSCPVCRSIVLPTPPDSMEFHSREAMLDSSSRMDRIVTSDIL